MRMYIRLMACLLLVISLTAPAFASETEQPAVPAAETEAQTGETGGASEEVHQHTWDAGTVTTAPTCTETGIKTYTCSCGAVSTETLPAAGHSYGEWFQSKSVHERTCSVCGKVDSGAHTMNAQVTTQPTCQNTGVQTNTCSVCGYSYTEQLPVSDHTYGDWDGNESSHSRACTVCGKTESGPHAWSKETVTAAATCKEEGIKAKVCVICEGVLYEVLPKLTTHTYDNACDPECNVCGFTRETEHKFSTVWSKNFSGHWHACTRCGEKTDIADHFPGPAATEEADQLCLTCGYVMTPKRNHVHKYSTTWSSDETGHWYACQGCEDQKDFAAHEFDDQCDSDCNICGYQTPTAHSYGEAWSSDETGHWTVCVLCGDVKETEAHIPDPNASETDAVLCTVCGYEISPAPVHVHEAGETWLSDGESHWKECQCGEILDAAPHAWDAGTENEDTTITYVCTECGAEKTEGEPKEPGGFPFAIVLAVLVVVAVGLLIALIVVLRSDDKKSGRFTK